MRHRPITATLRTIGLACVFSALTWTAPFAAQATTLSDNTEQVSSGTLAATATSWLAASFTSDADHSLATLDAVLSGSVDSGASTLALYSSDASGLIPDSLLATFTATSTDGGSLGFTLSGIDLLAGSSYWLVLSNGAGGTNWSWTEASEGTGTGFTGLWANSDDAGDVWFTNSTLYPLQAKVTVSAVPESATLLLWLGALPLLACARARSKEANA
ncbi:choice-of-anchor R domain-containing protein [Aquabacterium sp.]|uniref:choice-of-anchor R domain-containing protein n=1 Tax=Aquabacterium sp. TaxID=1872578 RepID=UPI003D6CE3EF